MDNLVFDKFCHLVFENCLDALLLTSADGKVHRAIHAACQMFQRSEQEIYALGRNGLVDSNDTRLKIALDKRRENGMVRTELNLVRKDGIIFPAFCASRIFKDERGVEWTSMIIRDITADKEAENKLREAIAISEQMASHDDLTGLLNRRAFMGRLDQEIQKSNRNKSPLCLILLDIDHFKNINDKFGHVYGDEILVHLAKILSNSLRPYDFIGRYGGDEFIICLTDTQRADALMIAERLRYRVEISEMPLAKTVVKTTMSIVVGCYQCEIIEQRDDLISRVDNNLYTAKNKRNCIYG